MVTNDRPRYNPSRHGLLVSGRDRRGRPGGTNQRAPSNVSENPIPRIGFLSAPDKSVWKMITTSLDAIPNYGHRGWMGWSSSEYFRFLLEWLLHGFGHGGHTAAPKEPAECEGADKRLASSST